MIRATFGLCVLLVFGLESSPLGGQEPSPQPGTIPGESLKVTLLTIGQGDLVWERFGHNAILIQDQETGWEAAYHWGVFSFEQVDFIPRLIRGTMLYSMGRTGLDPLLRGYQLAERPVWAQELALTPPQRWELLALVEENYRPENRAYRYDYYLDNCSNRARDALDRVLDGRMEALFSPDTTAFTFRWHTRRILREMPIYYLGIQFVLGPRGDEPITVWEEMFLPPTLMDRIGEVRVPDGAGGSRSLVLNERVLLEPGRLGPPSTPPTAPPLAFPIFLLAGVIWGGAIIMLVGSGAGLGGWRRLAVSVLAGGWGLVAALGGSLLLGAWLFTDHIFWYANYNLFQVNPFFFPLPVAFLLFLARSRFPRWGRDLAAGLGSAAVVGVVIELLPGLGQNNVEFLAFAVPLNLALWAATGRLYRKAGEGSPEAMGEAG